MNELIKQLKSSPKPLEQTSYVDSNIIAEMIVRDNRTMFVKYDRETGMIEEVDKLLIQGKAMPIIPFKPNDSRLLTASWASAVIDYSSDSELLKDIRAFIHKWVDLQTDYEMIAAFYVLFTYVYDEFLEVPYLRVLADLGSGKSRLGIDVLGNIVYKGTKTIAVSSTASLFRIMHTVKGTLVIDEADVNEKSDKSSELVQMLNSGYKSGMFIFRCEKKGKSDSYSAESFDVFGPKIIMSREHLKDHALESRCIPIKMFETTRKDLPFLVDRSLYRDAEVLRNKLLMWRFRNYGKHTAQIDPRISDLSISSRTKQLLMLLSSVINDETAKTMLMSYGAKLHNENVARRGDSTEGEVLEVMCKLINNIRYSVDDKIFLAYKDIRKEVNKDREEKEVSAKYIAFMCRETFGLEMARRAEGKGVNIKIREFNYTLARFNLPPLPESADYVKDLSEAFGGEIIDDKK